MRSYYFPIVIEKDKDGYFASCPVLQGCYTQGDTYEDTMENVIDAIRLHLEDRQANNEDIPHTSSVSVSTVEVRL